jgi:peptidoglycan/LPS O-acetylase OafA/YrhL
MQTSAVRPNPGDHRFERAELDPVKPAMLIPGDKRDVLIDYLRAIASFLVFIFHFDSSYHFYAGSKRLCFSGGWVGLDIFFLVSGVVITQSAIRRKASAKASGRQLTAPISFLNDRFFRIYPPFIAACLLAWGLDSLSPWMTQAAAAYPAEMADSLRFFWKPDALLDVAWTLRYEAIFYLLVTVYLFPGVRFIGLLFVLLVGASLEPARYQFHYGIYFLSGVFIAFGKARWRRAGDSASKPVAGRAWVRWLKGGAVLALFCSSLYYLSQYHTQTGALLLIGSYLVADFALRDIFRLRPAARPLQWIHQAMLYLGKMSYSLYLVHIYIVLSILKRLPPANHSFLEMLLIVVPVVLLSASIFHHVIEDYSVAVGRALAALVGRIFSPRPQSVIPVK